MCVLCSFNCESVLKRKEWENVCVCMEEIEKRELTWPVAVSVCVYVRVCMTERQWQWVRVSVFVWCVCKRGSEGVCVWERYCKRDCEWEFVWLCVVWERVREIGGE